MHKLRTDTRINKSLVAHFAFTYCISKTFGFPLAPAEHGIISQLPIGLVIVGIVVLLQPGRIAFSALEEVNFWQLLGEVAIVPVVLTFGAGDETGWRGTALPRL